jgi:lipid kinase, YegS/Rv2252/BmrU family
MGEMQRVCVIVNPAAGDGGCMKKLSEAKQILESRNCECEIREAEYKGHIEKLSEQASEEDFDCVVIAGGDGTVREAVGGLVYKDVSMFIFPFGTGNDLAKTLKIPTDPKMVVDKLLSGKPHKMDAGTANDLFFLNVAGLGFDVEVLINTEKYKKWFKKKSAYMIGLFSSLVHMRHKKMTIEVDNVKREMKSIILALGNGKYFGGGMKALPDASVHDGKLDLCVMHDVKAHRVIPMLMKFLKGKHQHLPETLYEKVTQISVFSENEMPVQLDGEIIEKTPVVFKILPEALRIVL